MSEHQISLTVDGERETLTVEGRTLLVHALREDLGVTAPKVGCETSKCGACTVELDGDVVKACTVLAVQADGKTVRTAASDTEDDVRSVVTQQFHEQHGLQCGYCTPGMVLTAADLLRENPDPTPSEIRASLKGNICRCTGYTNIVRAVESAASELEGTAAVAGDGGKTAAVDGSAPEGDD
ncbi:2Fe-2S iron-sulfur cluster binding domain-containing protein [Natronorubrum sp. JWXQ-INN-674]|uniref:2Fe-2S iron-sulfur cluster binding domain-containing protein n=1 Tax=Natronorubrum halalkaliphilum TaxID=2691917 RepID=A0A6B0VK38_9EURY|nr:(2Fe-2S)-binding protein [Natronorubrum halalkaliphilum]MXV61930.1 2Fe-2S iron-sulfur cluster binding domain-containing protein [Natronorubrum halalkaliphilum]